MKAIRRTFATCGFVVSSFAGFSSMSFGYYAECLDFKIYDGPELYIYSATLYDPCETENPTQQTVWCLVDQGDSPTCGGLSTCTENIQYPTGCTVL